MSRGPSGRYVTECVKIEEEGQMNTRRAGTREGRGREARD
jgi:hypothetical protein